MFSQATHSYATETIPLAIIQILIQSNPVNTDTEGGIKGARIKRVSVKRGLTVFESIQQCRAQLFEGRLALNPGFFWQKELKLKGFLSFQIWAQLFEDRLALNPGHFFFGPKAFSRIHFPVIFKSFQSSTCWQKELNWIYFLSFHIWMQISRYSLRYLNQALNKPALNSNLALTLGYLNPALTRLRWSYLKLGPAVSTATR